MPWSYAEKACDPVPLATHPMEVSRMPCMKKTTSRTPALERGIKYVPLLSGELWLEGYMQSMYTPGGAIDRGGGDSVCQLEIQMLSILSYTLPPPQTIFWFCSNLHHFIPMLESSGRRKMQGTQGGSSNAWTIEFSQTRWAANKAVQANSNCRCRS